LAVSAKNSAVASENSKTFVTWPPKIILFPVVIFIETIKKIHSSRKYYLPIFGGFLLAAEDITSIFLTVFY
jgi:hypothetical protein